MSQDLLNIILTDNDQDNRIFFSNPFEKLIIQTTNWSKNITTAINFNSFAETLKKIFNGQINTKLKYQTSWMNKDNFC